MDTQGNTPRYVTRQEPEEAQKRLAVLVDADNAQASIVEGLFEGIGTFGVASVKRIYGDWTQPNLGIRPREDRRPENPERAQARRESRASPVQKQGTGGFYGQGYRRPLQRGRLGSARFTRFEYQQLRPGFDPRRMATRNSAT